MSDDVSSKLREELEKLAEGGLDETDMELLDQNKQERDQILMEINELKERNERRKQERAEEEQRMASERAADDTRRKAEEEERKRKKDEDELKRKEERAMKRAEYEKMRNPQKANFVITRKTGEEVDENADEDHEDVKNKKSKEQLESEKRAILAQRVKPLQIDGLDSGKLHDKAKEVHSLIARLESEKYDLERRFKTMQVQLLELADRARQQNQVGKEGGLKRIHGTEDIVDDIQTKFAGAPSKVEMYSVYESQKDKRSFFDRKGIYTGPQFGSHADRIQPSKALHWDEDGMPVYQ